MATQVSLPTIACMATQVSLLTLWLPTKEAIILALPLFRIIEAPPVNRSKFFTGFLCEVCSNRAKFCPFCLPLLAFSLPEIIVSRFLIRPRLVPILNLTQRSARFYERWSRFGMW